MTDLHTLLREAAPTPAKPLDMAALRARADRRPARRIVAWIAGIGLVAGGIPVGAAVLSTASDGDQSVSVIDPDPTPAPAPDPSPTPDETDAPADPSTEDAAPAAVEPQSPASVDGGSAPADQESGTADENLNAEVTTPHDSAPGFEERDDFPLAAECSVDNQDLEEDGQRRCRFTATGAGGFAFDNNGGARGPGVGPTGEVIVTRNGQATSYKPGQRSIQAEQATVFAGCDDDIIRAGDRVEVILTNTDPATSAQTRVVLGAGEGWSC